MKIYFSQIYIKPGVTFPFAHQFQIFMSEEVTKNVSASSLFCERYGEDWDLIFRISAKQELDDLEISGPSKFKKDRDVEYTLFLPFREKVNNPRELTDVLEIMFDGIFSVLNALDISLSDLEKQRKKIVSRIISDPKMLKKDETHC